MYAKGVLIEQTEKGLCWNNPVLVTHNHKHECIIGHAWIMELNGKYYADISDLTIDPTGLYPSIGYVAVSDSPENPVGKIFEIAICDIGNQDTTIAPIGLGNGEVKCSL